MSCCVSYFGFLVVGFIDWIGRWVVEWLVVWEDGLLSKTKVIVMNQVIWFLIFIRKLCVTSIGKKESRLSQLEIKFVTVSII